MRDPLDTWVTLNNVVADMSEAECEALLKLELAGKRRKMFVLRIHSRINKLRAERERLTLIGSSRATKEQ